MTENFKNNIIRTGIVAALAGFMWIGVSACDTGGTNADDCKNASYYSQHVADCNDDGVISPFGYGMNY